MTGLLEDKRTVWIVAAVAFVLFLIGNLPWRLDDYDQAKQAFTSFEMIKESDWFYQQTPHGNVATKPPLVGWISAGLYALTRSWDVAWRLPSFLTATAIAILLFRAARSMDGRRSTRLAPERGEDQGEGSSSHGTIAGLIALSAFGLNLLSPRLATLVRTDMPLALVIFLIGLLIWEKIRRQEEWKPRDRIYLFALLTIAMLIKGPIVYAFLLPGIVLFQLCRGRARPPGAPGTNSGSAWPGWWPWVASFAIFLAWVVGGIRSQPGFYHEVVMREFIGRFGETIHRPQPLLFYLPHLLHKFAPWSVLMIAIALVDLRSRNWRFRSLFREMSPETFWLLCWSFGGLIAMSLIPSKRVDRIFPVIPPFCLLLAAQIASRNCSRGSAGPSSRSSESVETAHGAVATTTALKQIYRWSALALALAILFTSGYTGWKIVTGYRHHRDQLAVFGRNVRREAESHHWRYEVVSARDEGLLLYLQKIHFIDPQLAVTEWNNGSLDAVVVSTEKATMLIPKLEGAVVSELTKAEQGNYVLITH